MIVQSFVIFAPIIIEKNRSAIAMRRTVIMSSSGLRGERTGLKTKLSKILEMSQNLFWYRVTCRPTAVNSLPNFVGKFLMQEAMYRVKFCRKTDCASLFAYHIADCWIEQLMTWQRILNRVTNSY